METKKSAQTPLDGLQAEPPLSAHLRIHLFGGFELLQNGLPLPRTRTRTEQWLLAFLALRANREVNRSWLAGTFWPDTSPEQALNNLRRSLSNLRHTLGEEAYRLFSPSASTLTLDLAHAFCDAAVFDAAIVRGDDASLRQAVALYRGPLLPECEADWVLGERASRDQACVGTLETLAGQAQRGDNAREAAEWLRQALRLDPYRESAHCALMEALAAQGDRAGMTMAYRQFRLLLHEKLQSEPSEETKALYARLRAGRGQAKNHAPSPSAEHASLLHIPRPLSALVGRREETEEVTALLSRFRLVTLTGTGGVGKTRLALNVAAVIAPRFRDGVWFVDLAPVTDATAVTNAVCAALELREDAEQTSAEALRRFLANKEALLLLDNCEHLVDACATLAATLLQAAPDARLLATSRQALGVSGERAWRVPSLTLPEPSPAGGKEASESLLEYAAARLFVERAQEASIAFTLTARIAPFIADICRRLDGIPLAIELAAARVNVLSAEQIAVRLEDAFHLLTGGDRAALPRQQTLRGLLDWSYALLTRPEQRLLNALSVFAGGWTLEAAEAITTSDPLPPEGSAHSPAPPSSGHSPYDALDTLASLVDKSLAVMQESENGQVRYRLLETVRQYARDRLAENGESGAVRATHANYFLALAEEINPKLKGAEQAQWFETLEQEHDNMRQALRRYADDAEDRGAGEKGLRLAAAMQRFWWTRGYIREGQKWLSAFLAHPGGQEPTAPRADALNGAGVMAYYQGDYVQARVLYEESLEILRALGNQTGIIRSLGNLANIAYALGDHIQARVLDEESLAIARELGDKWGVATHLGNLGTVARYEGDYARAQVLHEESLQLSRELRDRRGEMYSLAHLGNVAYAQGDFTRAQILHEQSLAMARELGEKEGIATSLDILADLACEQGNYAHARVLLKESLATAREMDYKRAISSVLEGFADLALKEGEAARCVRLWAASAALREVLGFVLSPIDLEELERSWTAVRQTLGEAEYEAAWTQGSAMTLEQAIQYATEKSF